jgi:hypothetical protein
MWTKTENSIDYNFINNSNKFKDRKIYWSWQCSFKKIKVIIYE